MAGSCAPNGVGEEVTGAVVNACSNVYGRTAAQCQQALFGGVGGALGYSNVDVWYWYDSSYWADITIPAKCNIWAQCSYDYPSYWTPFNVWEWNGSAWVDANVKFQFLSPTNPGSTKWAKIYDSVPAGRYKFSPTTGYCIHEEWFLESWEPSYIDLHPEKIKTTLSEMNIGDFISCKYVATANVPGAFSDLGGSVVGLLGGGGSDAPNASFYFIKVDKGLLIADRVIQHSISWDNLNAVGLINGTVSAWETIVPSMSSNNANGIITSCSSEYDANNSAFRAFDRLLGTSSTGWVNNGLIQSGWLQIQFPEPVLVQGYAITGQNGYQGRSPRKWQFLGSNDGINWTILDSRFGMTGWEDNKFRKFIIKNKNLYSYYKIDITENNGDSYVSIGEFRLFPRIELIRCMTGGIMYLDSTGSPTITKPVPELGAWPINSEWDKHIVKSALAGDITPGDNKIWHWNSGVATWCKDTPSMDWVDTSYRIIRGNYAGNAFPGQHTDIITSASAAASYGFRPVLEFIDDHVKLESRPTTPWN